MTTPYTTTELGLAVDSALREERHRRQELELSIRLALRALSRDEIAKAERALRKVIAE